MIVIFLLYLIKDKLCGWNPEDVFTSLFPWQNSIQLKPMWPYSYGVEQIENNLNQLAI